MAIQATDKRYREENKRLKNLVMMIAGKGGSPGQPYDDPEKGKGPFVPAPGKGKLAGLQINPNTIMLPKEPAPAESDDEYGEGDVPGHPDWSSTNQGMTIAHSPSGTYDEYGRELKIAPYKGGNPGGQQIEIPWMKEEYEKKHPQLEQLHNEKYHQAGATSRQIRDRLKPFTKGSGYDNSGGSLRGIPDSLRIQLLRDAKA